MEEITTEHGKSNKKRWLIVFLVTVVVILIALGIFLYLKVNNGLLPDPIKSSVSKTLPYNIYYTDQKKLPSGYYLDPSSFQVTSDGAVTYNVNYGNNQTLYFSLEKKISSNQLNTFYTNYIPLHLTKSSPVGTATIGVIHNQTVVSIPTNTNTWIIITAPLNYDQKNLQQVLNSISLANK